MLACVPAGSTVRYNAQHGAQLITINATTVELAFWAATSPTSPTLIDCYAITQQGAAVTYSSCMPYVAPTFSLLTGRATSDAQPGTVDQVAWRYTSTASATGVAGWNASSFDDSAWPLGWARLGYGPDWSYNTTLPNASTKLLHHWLR